MALSVQSLDPAYASTQRYTVTGTVGHTITASIANSGIATIAPVSATMTAGGLAFAATRGGAAGGSSPLVFTDTTDGETVTLDVNMTGPIVVTPNPITGQVGDAIAVTVFELNDPDAFTTLAIDDTTVAQITASSNAEGSASLTISLLANGSTNLNIDDGHGGTLAVQIFVGPGLPAKTLTLSGIEAVIGGNDVKKDATTIPLQDTNTGYNGPGSYTISLTRTATAPPTYAVTEGIPPAESTTQINVCRVVVTAQGQAFVSDVRTLQVTVLAVNSTIMATANVDGSFLADGVVSLRALSQAVLNMLGTAQSGATEPTNPQQGQLFFNTTTNVFEVYENGTWVIIASAGASSTLAGLSDVALSSLSTGQVLAWNGTKWVNSSDADTLAGDSDVTISAPADGQTLVYNAGSGTWINSTASTLAVQRYMPLTNGDLPGPGIMADASGQCIAVAL